MKPRRRLQNRIARHISFVVALSLLVGSLVLLGIRHTLLRRSMEESAETYAALVALPVAEAADIFRSTGREVFKQRVEMWLALNRDVTSLEVVDIDGVKLMHADLLGVHTFPSDSTAPRIDDPEFLATIREPQTCAERVRTDKGVVFRVVAPAVGEWTRHNYSLVAVFSYRYVNRKLAETAWIMGLILAVGLLLSFRVSVVLARTITGSIEKLHDGIRRFQDGRLEERVDVRSGDEIEDLAEALNAMADTLADTIEQLREANRELENLDQAKADLVANVSHELKTPLTALRGYLELLGQGELGCLSENAQRAIEVCEKNVQRLGLRIEDLVQLSNLERSSTAGPILETVHLARLLHGVVETLLPRLENEGVLCSLTIAANLPQVLGNVEQLERVFLNLLDNARKFAPEGGFIQVSTEPSSQESTSGVVVRVADSGEGIPAREQRRIFDRFYQIDPGANRRYGGMGLGLSLARSIVEAHRGSIWVESQEGRGATFFVWLPCAPDSEKLKSEPDPAKLDVEMKEK